MAISVAQPRSHTAPKALLLTLFLAPLPAAGEGWPPMPQTPPRTETRSSGQTVTQSDPVNASYLQPVPPTTTEALRVFQPAETVARVGDQYVLGGELIGDANVIMSSVTDKLTPEQREENRAAIDAQRDRLVRQLLTQVVDRKLMYLDFMRNIPANKLKEVRTNIDKKIGDAFRKDLEEMLDKLKAAEPRNYADLARRDSQLFRLALMMKEAGLDDVAELDVRLRTYGTSMHWQQQAYMERKLGQQQMIKEIDYEPEITHDEMLTYYQAQVNEFRVPARARWEQLTARFNNFPSKAACGQAIADMGNEVVLGGAPFWAVAQRRSQGPNAKNGGSQDWTEWGDLKISREINDAVFSLPLMELSRPLEDAEGFHIVRVLERQEAHLIPFKEAQVPIKEKLLQQKRNEAIAKYVAKLRKITPVSTIYDKPQDEFTSTRRAGTNFR
jgi:parvulin-like peptidyl-prolyl isomerase